MRIGVIGTGRIGTIHAHTLSRHREVGSLILTDVDPARAQGYKGWTNPAFGPSPLSAPFYVYERNGNEYRERC